MNGAEFQVLSTIFNDNDEFKTAFIATLVEEQILDERYSSIRQLKRKRVSPSGFYEITIPEYTMDQFKNHFKMSRTTFEAVLVIVAAEAHGEPVANICLQKKLLFVLWVLCTQEPFMSASERFDIPKKSNQQIFNYLIWVLSRSMPRYVKWPTEAQQVITEKTFKKKSLGIPGVIGVLDACHISIEQPVKNRLDYHINKLGYSIILQAVCDSESRFIDVNIGQPGRMESAQVLRLSPLYAKITHRTNPLIPKNMHIIGDAACPLHLNLLTPYQSNGQLSAEEVIFNRKIALIQQDIDKAFALLKLKFCRLGFLDVGSLKISAIIVSACCMLHNFILMNDDDRDFTSDIEYRADHNVDVPSVSSKHPTAATRKRDVIKNLIL